MVLMTGFSPRSLSIGSFQEVWRNMQRTLVSSPHCDPDLSEYLPLTGDAAVREVREETGIHTGQ